MYIAFPAHSRNRPAAIFAVGVSRDDAVLAAKIQYAGDSQRYDRDALSPDLDTLPCSDALAARYAQSEPEIDYRIVNGVARLREEARKAVEDTLAGAPTAGACNVAANRRATNTAS